MAWNIFLAFERNCRIVTGGYSGVRDVMTAPRNKGAFTGRMESFFTAETLKYLYLLFGDGTEVPLDHYVFNTEAHPLYIYDDYRWGSQWGSLPDLHKIRFAEPGETHEEAKGRAAMLTRVASRMNALQKLAEL